MAAVPAYGCVRCALRPSAAAPDPETGRPARSVRRSRPPAPPDRPAARRCGSAVANRGQAMRDHNPSGDRPLDPCHRFGLALVVDPTRRLVQEDDSGVLYQRCRDADALVLPPENVTAFSPNVVNISMGMAAMSRSTAASRAVRQASSTVRSRPTPMMMAQDVAALQAALLRHHPDLRPPRVHAGGTRHRLRAIHSEPFSSSVGIIRTGKGRRHGA